MQLSDIAIFVEQSIRSTDISLSDYVTTDSLLQNREGRIVATNLPPSPCNLTFYQPGDILMANIRPYLKKIWMADRMGGCSADVLVFRAKENISSNYLYSVLLQDFFFDYVMLAPKGSKMPRGDKNHIMRFPIIELPSEEANKVGDFIYKIENKLANNRKQNAILEKMAKHIYDYWFVQFDFPDKNGRPYKSSGGKMVWNETLKREIPIGWDVKDIDSLCSFNNRSLTTRTMPNRMLYLDTSNLTQNYITELQELTSNFPSRARRLVQNKTILYSTVRPNLCHYGILINPDNELVVSTGFATIDVNDEDVLSPYMLYSYLTSPSNVQYLHNIAVNAVSSYPSINPSDIGQMKLAIPHDTSIMKDYNSRVADIYSKINTNCIEIKHLSELRSYLLPLLMTGQVKL